MRIRRNIRKHDNYMEFVDLLFADNGRMIRRVFLRIRFHMIECYHSESRHGATSFEGHIDFGVLWILNEVPL